VPASGGHRQYKHPTKPGRATIPFHRGDLSLVVIKGLERQTGLKLRR
jgi:predicted RNA binding protein YcfA (HicA-like mRNA interferase family)